MKILFLSHYNEKLDWTDYLEDDIKIFIETKCKGEFRKDEFLFKRDAVVFKSENIGREAVTIARYYCQNTEDHVMFLQAFPLDVITLRHTSSQRKPRWMPFDPLSMEEEDKKLCCQKIHECFRKSTSESVPILTGFRKDFFPTGSYLRESYRKYLKLFVESYDETKEMTPYLPGAGFVRSPLKKEEIDSLSVRLKKIENWIISEEKMTDINDKIVDMSGAGHDYSKSVFLERSWPVILQRDAVAI